MKEWLFRLMSKRWFSLSWMLITGSLIMAQEGLFTIAIQQPVGDTLYVCQNQNLIFLAAGTNEDGSAFNANEVTFTWDFGYQGASKTGHTVSYAYPEGGHYELTLSAASVTGNPAQNQVNLHVFVSMTPLFTGTRSDQSSFCSGEPITLTGFVQAKPWTGDAYPFTHTYDAGEYSWEGAAIGSDYHGVARAEPPLNEGHLEYVFRVQDNFGCFHDTTLLLYGVYAEYTMDPLTGEAPLEVTFSVDSSSNGGLETGIEYQWDYWEMTLDSLAPASSVSEMITLEHPGEYLTSMTAVYGQCTYTLQIDQTIRVDSSLLEIPNVFTPNEDGLNDFFQVKAVSLQSFHGQIFNRWGRLVYEWTDWKDPESGWNGKNLGSGGDAPPGTYFYVIRAVGWDYNYTDEVYKPYEGKIYTGSLTLLR